MEVAQTPAYQDIESTGFLTRNGRYLPGLGAFVQVKRRVFTNASASKNAVCVTYRSFYTRRLSSRRYNAVQHGIPKQEASETPSWCSSFGAHSTFIGSRSEMLHCCSYVKIWSSGGQLLWTTSTGLQLPLLMKMQMWWRPSGKAWSVVNVI